MGVVILLWKERLLDLIDVRRNPLPAGTFWVFLMLVLFYVFIILEVYNREPSLFSKLSVDDLMLGLVLMTILQSFLPSYQPIVQWIPKHLPYPRQLRLLAHIGLELMTSYYLILLAVALLVLYYFGVAMLPVMAVWVAAVLVMHLLIRQFKMFWEYQWESFPWAYLFVWVAVLAIELAWSPSIQSGWAWSFRLVVLVLMNWWTEGYLGSKRTINTTFSALPPLLLLVLRSLNLRISFLVGLCFKALILGLDFYRMQVDGVPLFETPVLIWLWVSPAFVFTYVLNNLWGFLSGLSFLQSLALPSIGRWLRLQGLIALPLLVPDMFMTVLYLSLRNIDVVYWMAHYSLAIMILWPLGMLTSVVLPIRVDQAFSWRLNTHIGAAVLSVALAVGIFYLPLTPMVFASSLVGSFCMSIWAYQRFKRGRHRLFHQLG